MSTRSLIRVERSEDGSMVVVVTVMLVIAMSVAVMVSTVSSGLSAARNDQNRINAFQRANAGIDQALWRIDHKNLPAPGAGGFIQASDGAYGFTDTVEVDGSSYEVTAVQSPANQDRSWTVRSIGTDRSGKKRQAIATIESRSLFENGFFTVNDFSVSGNQGHPIAYRSSICLDPFNPTAGCLLTNPIDGTLGTNGTLFAESVTPGQLATYEAAWKGFRMYGHPDLASARNFCAPNPQGIGQCSDSKVLYEPDLFDLTSPEPTVEAASNGCLDGPEATGAAIIAAGDYLCEDGLTLGPGNVSIATTGRVRIWVNGDFGVAPNTYVNRLQSPQRFQVFQPCRPPASGTATCDPDNPTYSGSVCEQGDSKQIEIWGLLFTPGLKVKCEGGSQPFFIGSVVADFYDGTGNQFDFIWDADAATTVHDGLYFVKNWRECPADKTDC